MEGEQKTHESDLLTVKEVAKSLSICLDTAYRIVRKGDLAKVYVGTGQRSYRITRASLEAYKQRTNS